MSLGRILIVEDNELNQYLLKSILKKRDFEIELANDGVEALAIACSGKFDLILTDIHMPNMNGLEFVNALKALADNPNAQTPIIAITADNDDDMNLRCIGVGMVDVIHKPIDRQALIEKAMSCIGISHSDAQATTSASISILDRVETPN